MDTDRRDETYISETKDFIAHRNSSSQVLVFLISWASSSSLVLVARCKGSQVALVTKFIALQRRSPDLSKMNILYWTVNMTAPAMKGDTIFQNCKQLCPSVQRRHYFCLLRILKNKCLGKATQNKGTQCLCL